MQNSTSPTVTRRRARQLLLDAYRFVRFSAFGATAVLPLLGVATVTSSLALAQTAGLLAVAAAFHCFAYVSNDVFDLHVDRTQPLRHTYPLVRGRVPRWFAVAFALVQLPLAFGLTTALRSSGWEFAMLGIAVLLMTVYNTCGKRAFAPPLTDLAQGVGWAALIVYGAVVAEGRVTAATWLFGAMEVVFIMLVNGVHGSLRDLANDYAQGVRSTAIWLGTRPSADGGVLLSPGLVGYALALQSLFVLLLLVPLLGNWFGYQLLTRSITALLLVALLACAYWLPAAARSAAPPSLGAIGMLHLAVLLSAPVVLVVATLDPGLAVVLVVVHIVPLLANGMTYDGLRWLRQVAHTQ